jgi:hypothetical protein
MAKKNSYEKKAIKKHILDGITAEQAKGDIKKSGMKTGRDILIGAIGGGLAGAVIGRSSFLVGIAVTGIGHYMGSDGAASFGVGMMASGGYQAVAGAMSGTEQEGFEGVKERIDSFKEEFKRKLFLDKLLPAKKKEETKSGTENEQGTNGMGEVQYFTYPNSNGKELEGAGDIDLSALDKLEKRVEESAKKYEAKKQESMSGGQEYQVGALDLNEPNY